MNAADERFMRRALALAEQARGLTAPNPMVGAIVVRDGDIVGEGFHAAAGSPHAEIEALGAAGERARGATLYVTLEPCAHWGRTPPCAPAVVAAGLRRVVVAVGDPNPVVAGRGLALLRQAGIEVTVGVLAAEAERQNRIFLTSAREGRPHVTLKAAMTLDGKIADVHGQSRWITGEPARREAHRLRSEADAVVVGVTTVLRDDPELTVRLDPPWPREPFRVVLDTEARTPPTARLIGAGTPARALIMVGPEAGPAPVRALEASGATVVRLATGGGRLDPAAVLADLLGREVRGALLEGGGEVHGAFLDAGLVDRVAIFVAPRLLGGREAAPVVAGLGRALKDAVRLGRLSVRTIGDDLLIEADVVHASAADRGRPEPPGRSDGAEK
jgi:diaminohydroxyphosphoribosylaminopyrimidine deaminase/5-amino-6-(5-phosphoribosylamino)uracil reductase